MEVFQQLYDLAVACQEAQMLGLLPPAGTVGNEWCAIETETPQCEIS